jgi:Flp pilus assembly protein TadB
MAVSSGLTLPLALAFAADHAGSTVGAVLGRVLERHRHGETLADALRHVGADEGDPLEGLLSSLATAQRSGAPLHDALGRSADRQRQALRREAEARVRRLPVTMLLPLVCCVLPAFVLLTIVPVLAGGAGGFRLP